MKKKKNVFPKASKAFLFFHTWLFIILYLRGVIILTTHVDGLVHVAVGCGVLTGPLHVGASASFWGWGIGARAVCAQLVVARARLSADFFFFLSFSSLQNPSELLFPRSARASGAFPTRPHPLPYTPTTHFYGTPTSQQQQREKETHWGVRNQDVFRGNSIMNNKQQRAGNVH